MDAPARSTSVWLPDESAPEEARLRSFALAATAAALLALFWPLILGRLFLYADLGGFFLPLRVFLAERLERGESALWMPHLFCGFHAHGEGQLGLYHPLRRLAYTFLPVDRAFSLETLLPLPVALAGFALLLRRLGLPASAALFGGVCFGLSPYLTLRLTHLNTIAVLAHVPWLLLAADVLARERSSRGARDVAWLGVALLTGSQLLLGYPPAVVLSLLVELGYAASLAMRGARAAPLAALLAAKLVGLLLGAPQWLPTWEELPHSARADPGEAFRSQQSLHPANLLLPLAPWLYRDRVYQVEAFNPIEQAFYLGAVSPVALIWVLARGRRLAAWPRQASFDALAACGVALVLASGRYLPAHGLMAQVPVIGLLRVPARYTLIVSLVSALFAALAFADLCRAPAAQGEARRALRAVWLAPALALAIAVTALALRRDAAGAAWLAPPLWILCGPLLLAAAAWLFAAAARGARFALPALFAFALLDLASYAGSLWWSEPPLTLPQYLASVPPAPSAPPGRLMTDYSMRIERDAEGAGHFREVTRLIVHDTRLVHGYVGLVPARALDYRQGASLRLAGATHVELDGRRQALAPPFPRARLLSRSVTSADPAATLARVDPAETAIVSAPLALGGGAPGSAAVLRDAPGEIRVRVAAPTRQLLVLTESHHEGWQARCDGAPCATTAVYGDFLGAVVEPGVGEVSLRFAPASVERGLRLAALGAALLLALPLASLTAARRRRGASEG